MKKIVFALMSIIILVSSSVAFADDIFQEDDRFAPPEIDAKAAIVMDMKSGRIIYSKNPDEQLYPASTTKILTGILALELSNPEDQATATVAALAPITNEDSHMGILLGETLTMEQLINGMMVYSANDAANVIATTIAGTSEHFVELMNQKAQEIGASNTNFTNAYGIHDPNHYTTAADLALISRYAMQNEKFREIVKQPVYNIPATNKYKERVLPSTNLFLGKYRSSKFYDPNVTGIKTGHTNDAGYCLVASSVKGDTELLTVVLKSKNQDSSYTSTKALLNYGFLNYNYTTIAKSGDVLTEVDVMEAKDDVKAQFTVAEDISALLPNDIDIANDIEIIYDLPSELRAPINEGDHIGTVSFNYKGSMIGYTELVATNKVERNVFLFILHMILFVITSPFFYIPALILVIVLIIKKINTSKQERYKRMRRLRERETDRKFRDGTKNPINPKFEDSSKRKNSSSRYSKK